MDGIFERSLWPRAIPPLSGGFLSKLKNLMPRPRPTLGLHRVVAEQIKPLSEGVIVHL